ncbi:hypothetical protein CVT24_008163 [Panaeolus cyanescens]|uniref:Uncharacterized protein n=1 Tax=Panaeolus cyanescens TaxID=181874 RepID=A0A409VFD9_9AGAR|nr:hypothetical protein CVT24_008163 [Panaeolus cyanescens]
MSNYTTTVGPRPRPASRPPQPRPSATRVTNPNTLSWVTYSPHDHPGPTPAQSVGAPTPGPSSRPLPLPNPHPRPLRIVNATEPQNLDDDDGAEKMDPNAFSPQYPNLAGPSSRPQPEKKHTLMGGLVKGFSSFPKKMFSRTGSTNSGSEHSFPTRRATAGTDVSIPPLPGTFNSSATPSKPMPQSRYLPKPPSQPAQFIQPSLPTKPMQPSIAELNANTMLLRPYPQPPLSEIPEVESNAPTPPPQVVRLSNTDHPRARTNSIRRVPPPPVPDPANETGGESHDDNVPRITIMDFNESRNTQYPNDQSLAEREENRDTRPEETMPGGLSQPSHGHTLSYVSSDHDQQGPPVFPILAPPPIRSPSPPHNDTPFSPDIRSPSPARSPSPPRAEPNPNARPPTSILFKPQTTTNTRSITPPPSLIPGNRLSVATPFPLHQSLEDDEDYQHEGMAQQPPPMLFTNPMAPMGDMREPDDLLSPISVHPQPADDYRVMTTMSPEPLATQTGTTLTGSSYYRSDRSFSSDLNPIERFFKRLYNLPWISRDRVTVDYLPGEQEKRGKIRPKKVKPNSSWYHAVLGRTKRNSNSNSLDLLTTGSGSAHDKDRRPRDDRDERGRTRTKEKRRHHHHESASRDKDKHHRHHHHHRDHHSSSRHRHHHHHHDHHHHRHHSGSRHSNRRRRTTSTESDEVERMKGMPPMPVYPFPYPPFPVPPLPGFPIPVVATTEDGETLPPNSPPRAEGQPEGAHHERPRTRSLPRGAAFGVYAPPGYQPYQPLVAPGAPPVYMFAPQQMGINVKQAAGNAELRPEHPHPKIEPVTNSPAAPVPQTIANAAAALAAEEKAKEAPSVPGSFA